MTSSGPKVGSGYARWRAPSKAALFLRRWWWAGATMVVIAGATLAVIAEFGSRKVRLEAQSRAKQFQRELHYAREYLRRTPVGADLVRGAEYRQMAGFTMSLTDTQIQELAAGAEIPIAQLFPQQRQKVKAYADQCRGWASANLEKPEGWFIDAIAFGHAQGVGPSFRIYGIKTRSGERIFALLWGFPVEWREKGQ